MLVVGSANSSNTARLVEVAQREGCRAELIEDVSDLELGWLAGARTIGLTAGASAPDVLVQEVLDTLRSLGPLRLSEERTSRRNRPFCPTDTGALMPIPFRQNLRIGAHLMRHRLKKTKYYPFIVEIEPLFACNLSCPGCGKIQHPTEILRKRLSVEDVLGAVDESGTPMVSIAGGEPLLHPDIQTHGRRARQAQGLRLPVHQRRAAAPAPRPVHALALLLLGRAHGRPAGAPRHGRGQGRCLRRGGGRDPRGQGTRVSG